MSTSLAVQPALRTTKTERSQANPGRTIFGTTLDNYEKCWTLLKDPKVVREAVELHNKKQKWHPRNPTPKLIVERAWSLRESKQAELKEEIIQDYNKKPVITPSSVKKLQVNQKENFESAVLTSKEDSKSISSSHPRTSSSRFCKSVASNRSAGNQIVSRSNSTRKSEATKFRPMSEPARGRCAPGGNVRVPRFRLPPGMTNFMKTSSMKITESGAKDLLNAKPVNKIGLGETHQYNYQAFQRRDTPKFYRDNGHVLLLGQRFTDRTTNKEEDAPGGFYKSNGPDRFINERFRYVKDRKSEVTMTHNAGKPQENRITIHRKAPKEGESKKLEYEIPLNLLHKYGEENVSKVLNQYQDEFFEALQKPTELKSAALVPPRTDVKELNHPIDPPTTYFTNFGENLKYDKFEGGLHLYIK